MISKTEFLTIYATYGSLEVVKQTLPTVIRDTKNYGNAQLIVHDSTQREHGQKEKWQYLRALEEEHGFFLILSTNLSMAHARNMCLQLGQELYAPEYIAMMEDDHGYKPSFIQELVQSMKDYYGKKSRYSLRYGLFTGCTEHAVGDLESIEKCEHKTGKITKKSSLHINKVNSCFRCAPTSHWNNVLKGYDTDEYLISYFQTFPLNMRNYNKGFTNFFVKNGELMFSVQAEGRGDTAKDSLRLWDKDFAASDPRSNYIGKDKTNVLEDKSFLNRFLK